MKAGSCHWILKTASGAVGCGSLLLNSDSAGSEGRCFDELRRPPCGGSRISRTNRILRGSSARSRSTVLRLFSENDTKGHVESQREDAPRRLSSGQVFHVVLLTRS